MQGAPVRQHLIDPQLCIRCNTCEETCPAGAVTHGDRNYVVDPDRCNGCQQCLVPCPTGAIDNWRMVGWAQRYDLDQQQRWDELPAAADGGSAAAQPAPLGATVVSNARLSAEDADSEVRQLTLDLSGQPFSYLEGQSVGILPPGTCADGRPHPMRLYSIASARDGEAGVAGHLALTVKRTPGGVCSNYVCDLAPGQQVQVLGPFGDNFLMPDDPAAPLLMICTGTGIAPMRGMIERRLRQAAPASGELQLFYGARTPGDMAYAARLAVLGRIGCIDLNCAYSRSASHPRRHVQDLLLERHVCVARLLGDGRSHIYLCGLKGMETGVLAALAEVCRRHGLDWDALRARLAIESRLHIETY
jgi:benzoyl-CoA oxygenase/reductase BoxA protein